MKPRYGLKPNLSFFLRLQIYFGRVRYDLGKVHKHDMNVLNSLNMPIDSWFKDGFNQGYFWPIGYTNSTFFSQVDYEASFVGMIFEFDWYATMKGYRFIDNNRVNDQVVEIQGRMKYGDEIYSRFLIYPFEWCASRNVVFKDNGIASFVSQN